MQGQLTQHKKVIVDQGSRNQIIRIQHSSGVVFSNFNPVQGLNFLSFDHRFGNGRSRFLSIFLLFFLRLLVKSNIGGHEHKALAIDVLHQIESSEGNGTQLSHSALVIFRHGYDKPFILNTNVDLHDLTSTKPYQQEKT